MSFGPKTTQTLLSDVLGYAEKDPNLRAVIVLRKPNAKPPLWFVAVLGALGSPDVTTEDKLLDVALRRVSSELSRRGKA